MANIPSFEVPPQLRDLAETSVEQARKAFGTFIGSARRAADTVHGSTDLARTNAQGLYTRSLDYAEQNVRAAFDLAQKLATARSYPEALQLQADYVRERFAAIQAQAKDLGGLAQGAFQQGAERARSAVQQGVADTQKAVQQGQDAVQQTQHAAEQASH
ncbi:phasin [Methylobacterium pseudosasicola]|uniref:Phasin n=1 Tax=Methylobacterium pseudosasicola TaxID=582667 RepID=A0A1I4NE32_9HYPH|nr:phasin [Methylobacterium pseudosasicola]SFM13645.1 phasin [Methylobacterium pseudosasicola]